jgi:seryl-tRNA synthetase
MEFGVANKRRVAMAEQQITYDGLLELFRQTREDMKVRSEEIDRKIQELVEESAKAKRMLQESAKQIKKTHKEVGNLTSRIGEIIENMVGGGNIVKQFQALKIPINAHSRNKTFGTEGTDEEGEIDVFLENGDIVILIEVKTRLTDSDVRKHIKTMKKYRLYGKDGRRILGAVAGGVVSKEVKDFAHKHGMYVIVQSGEAVEIVTPPKGFKAKEW